MDSSVILISSDSSAPSSPICETGSKPTLDCIDKHHPAIDARSDRTVEYYMPINLRKKQGTGDGYHNSCASHSDSKNTVECAEVQLSDSDAGSDTTVDYYPAVNLIKQSVSESGVSGSYSGILHEAQKERHQLMDYKDLDKKCDLVQRQRQTSVGSVLSEDCSQKGRGKHRAKNAVTDIEKERRRAKRIQNMAMMKAEKARKKAVKMAYCSKRPGECLKYIQVCLDQQLLTAEYGGEVLVSLQSAEIQYNIQSNPVPFSIFWTREIQEHFVGDDMKVHVRSRKEEDKEMLIVWHWKKVMMMIHVGNLAHHIQSLQLTLPGKKLTLVVYGAEEYFRHQKTFKRREVRAQVLGKEGKLKTSKKEANFESVPQVSQDEWETALTELHLFTNCSHRLMEKPQALGAFIKQFSKAVAEAPFKREKHKRGQENLQWYAAGDSRDCVQVDKNGNGLLRLWQQQLCQFNRVAMETAKAITSVYRSPSALVQAYENCSSEREAELMLEAIPIRRGVGPLTTVKKVGPDLSKKVYTFFTAFDGKAALSQE